MKKTILEERRVSVLREVLINENTLLLYKQNEKEKDKVDIFVRFIEQGSIREHFLTSLPKEKLFIGLMEISKDGKGIATYKEEGEDFVLDRVYDTETHSFAVSDFIDLEYKKLFPYNEISPQLVKKRGTKDGKH